MENCKIILGLDISTKTIGVTLFADDGSDYGKVLKMSHISPKVGKGISKTESLFLKKKIFQNEFIANYKDYNISRVIIEAPLLRSQNINTVATLLKFNGMISDCIYTELGIVPDYISSYDARRYAFPELMSIRKFNKKGEKYDKKHYLSALKKNQLTLFGNYPWDISKKELLLGNISEIYPNIEFILDKYGNLVEENFDGTDSLVAILGQLSMDKNKDNEFKIIDFKEDSNKITYIVSFGDKKFEKMLEI